MFVANIIDISCIGCLIVSTIGTIIYLNLKINTDNAAGFRVIPMHTNLSVNHSAYTPTCVGKELATSYQLQYFVYIYIHGILFCIYTVYYFVYTWYIILYIHGILFCVYMVYYFVYMVYGRGSYNSIFFVIRSVIVPTKTLSLQVRLGYPMRF